MLEAELGENTGGARVQKIAYIGVNRQLIVVLMAFNTLLQCNGTEGAAFRKLQGKGQIQRNFTRNWRFSAILP